MNNQPMRASAADNLQETYSNDFRATGRLQTSDATATQNDHDEAPDGKQSEPRTADRWWLRKRLMGN